MVIGPRSAVGIAAIWLAAVAGVSATAWVAIDRAGRDITDASVGPQPPAPLNIPTLDNQPTTTDATPEPSATTTSTPAPTPTATPTVRTPTTRPAPIPRDRTIGVTGGLVSVRCTGATIGLHIAQPQNEWRVHVETYGTRQIVVSFRHGDDEEQHETQVTAVCTSGSPAFTVTNG